MLEAVKCLSLVVKGNMDNAEPLLVIGGIGNRKTHYFENVVNMEADRVLISENLKAKINEGYRVGLIEGGNFSNEDEIKAELNTISIEKFFEDLENEVKAYYEGIAD